MRKLLLLSLPIILALSGCGPRTPKESSSSESLLSSSDETTASVISSETSESSESTIPEPTEYVFDHEYQGNVAHVSRINEETQEEEELDEYKIYSETHIYKNDYFLHDSSVFDVDLAALSLGLSVATGPLDYVEPENAEEESMDVEGYENVESFMEKMHFDDIYINEYFKENETEDTAGFALGHRHFDDIELVAVAIRGFDYGDEMKGNFKLGKTDNASGFNSGMQMVYDGLSQYISNSLSDTRLKLWITGYSRGGAIANLLGAKINDEIDSGICPWDLDKGNTFVYTFATPKGLTMDNVSDYENIYNIIHLYDGVTQVAPSAYNLKRCGTDIVLHDDNELTLLNEYDEDIVIKPFAQKSMSLDFKPKDVENPTYTSILDLYNSLFSNLLAERSDTKYLDISTRDNYVDNFEPTIMYAFNIYNGLTKQQKDALGAYFEDNLSSMIGNILGILFNTKDSVYKILKPALESIGLTFNEEEDAELKEHSAVIQKLVYTLLGNYNTEGSDLFGDIGTMMENAKYMTVMHTPEIMYTMFHNNLVTI